MNILTTISDTGRATFQTASNHISKPVAVNSCGSIVMPRIIATKQQTESITVRVTTRPLKLSETTT